MYIRQTQFMEKELEYAVKTALSGGDYGSGQLEEVQTQAQNNTDAIARLMEVLVEKELLGTEVDLVTDKALRPQMREVIEREIIRVA